jgi:Tfp pilus assembly protein PilF
MASALVRFGLVLRHSGAHEDALKYFEHLQQHAISSSDFITEAIAYHNIGLCLIGLE